MSLALSIIVPVYNTCNYLRSCVDSILSQNFSDFECILVDDGSTDGSGVICDLYARKDERIHVVHKENGGVSSARNCGLANACGEWALFIDSDDILPDQSINLLMHSVCDDVDMVYGAVRKFDESEKNIETIAVFQEGTHSIDDALDDFVAPENKPGDWQRYLFNRIYRLSIINEFGLSFPTNVYYKEDGLFVVQYLCRCKNKVACIKDVVYLYRQTNNSAMGSLLSSYNTKLLTNIDAHGQILRELENRGVGKDLLERERRHLYQNYYWILGIMTNTGNNTSRNRRLLKGRMIKNVGFFGFFIKLVIPRYCSKIKRLLSK